MDRWTGGPIFDEEFEAWPKGPVVRSVFRENRYASLPARVEVNDDVRATLDSVLDFYGHRGYEELVELTHVDAPWIDARRGLDVDEPSQRIVKRNTMLDFSSSRAIKGGDVPERRAHVENADTDETGSLARSVIDRWKEGLALLANK
ncbi:Panacea domain-containing protein [Rathayibacter tritici]|uniref:Panacea domain-containing protein n=1 Tax=Rathayibacter tritici TaxID=33888 RepID=UPI0015E22348|nr:type II toxin-antitoxin system antitoxin SocA domain-containing protein [Rathayibacter tritici]